MPDAQHLDTASGGHAIKNDVWPYRCEFACPAPGALTSAIGKLLEPVAGGHELDRNAGSSQRTILGDIGANVSEISRSARCERRGHFGGGNSLSVPHDSNQRRIRS